MDLTKILKVGDSVYSPIGGYGIVSAINNRISLPIKVEWENENWSTFTKDGKCYTFSSECLLFPSENNRDWNTWETEKKCPFKPFDKVLVRHHDNNEWQCGYFSHLSDSYNRYCVSASYWNQCIPYNKETQHLVGINQDCPDKYKIW